MKKLLGLLISMCFAFISVEAQNLGYNETYFKLTPSSTLDKVTTGDSTWNYVVTKEMDARCQVHVDFSIEKTAGTSDTAWIYLESKMFENQSYSKVDSILWDGQGTKVVYFSPTVQTFTGVSDSIVSISQTAIKLYSGNKYWQIRYAGTNDSFTAYVRRLNFKFVK